MTLIDDIERRFHLRVLVFDVFILVLLEVLGSSGYAEIIMHHE